MLVLSLKRTTHLLLLLCLASSSCHLKKREGGSASPEENGVGALYVISSRDLPRPPGWTLTRNTEISGEKMPATMQAGSQILEGHFTSRDSRNVVHQSLGAERYRVTVQRSSQATTLALNGLPPQSERAPGVLVRKFVIVEKKDGAWSGRLESGEKPTAAERERIDDHVSDYNLGDPLCDRAEARIGEEWVIDGAKTSWADGGTGTMTVRFDRVENFRGDACAVLTGSIDFKETMESGRDGDMRMKGTFTAYRSLKHLVDMHVVLEGTMEVVATPQLGITLKTSGPVRWTEDVNVAQR